MQGVDFVHHHRAACATTQDLQRLVYMAWTHDQPSPTRLPWLWLEPSPINQRGVFLFRASPTMVPFLQQLNAWFDLQETTDLACHGQLFFTPSTDLVPSFDWLVPETLIDARRKAFQALARQPTISDWWTTFIQYTPLWLQCMFGWEKPDPNQWQLLQWSSQATAKMLPLFIKKTQAYYASSEKTQLSWAVPPGDHLLTYLALVNGALNESTISMQDPSKIQLRIHWRKHAPLLLELLDLQGSCLCNEYNIAEIPHDFLTNTLFKQPAAIQSIGLPPAFFE